MSGRAPFLLLCLAAAPVRAEEPPSPTAASEDAVTARRREARDLARKARWDEAAAAFLEVAAARDVGWEGDARDARASAACATALRGEKETARAALRAILEEDPANLIARAGLASLAAEPPPAPPAAASADPDLLYREALALAGEGRLLAARERLRQCLRADPRHPGVERNLPKLERDLLEQVEESLHRHDRPHPAALPDERLFLRRADQARREGHLPEDAPLTGPLGERLPERRTLLADAGPDTLPIEIPPPVATSEIPTAVSGESAAAPADPEDTPPTEAERSADLAHGLAQAATLEKSEAFEQAGAVLEALKAAHPEARREVQRGIDALRDARLRAENARKAREREAAAAEERRAREETEAEEAAAEARRRQAYETGLTAFRASDWVAARAAFEALQQSDPGYRDVPDLLRETLRAQEKAVVEAREQSLRTAKEALEGGRLEEARAALGALDPKEEEVRALLAAVAEAAALRTKEEAEARIRAEAALRAAAVEAALRSAQAGDFKEARSQLYELKTQHPDDPRIEETLSRVAALEERRSRPETTGPRSGNRAAPSRTGSRERAEAAERACADGRALYFEGRLEEARERFRRALEADPSRRESKRYLSRIEREIRGRAEAGTPSTTPSRVDAVPTESSDERCRKALALYDSGDFVLAEPLLRSLSGESGLGWWQRRRVGRALAEIDRRRADSRAAASAEIARAASEQEAQRLREIAYFLDTGRADDARRALASFLSGTVSVEARREAEALKARLPGR